MSDKNLTSWDPKAEDYNDPVFNSYLTSTSLSRLNKESCVQLYVRGIPNDLTNKGLENLFLMAGDVKEATVVSSKKINSSTTYGFVTMKSLPHAQRAIHLLDGYQLQHCRIHIQMAKSEEEKDAEKKRKEREEEFLRSLEQNHLDRNNSNNIYDSDEKSSQENSALSSQKSKPQKGKGRSGILQQWASSNITKPGILSNEEIAGSGPVHVIGHRNSPYDDGYESENFGDLKGNRHNQSKGAMNTKRTYKPLSFGMGQGPEFGWARPPALAPYPEMATAPFDRGFIPAPPFPSVGRGMDSFWLGQFNYGGPQACYDYQMPSFTPGMGRGLRKYPSEYFGRPSRQYQSHESRPREEGFNRTLINSSESEKRRNKYHCIACKKPASKRCRRCKLPYCSVTCQKKHYPEHKETCIQLQLMQTNACNQDDLDSRFDVSVNMNDVENFSKDLDNLLTDVSDTESLPVTGARHNRKNMPRRGQMNRNSNKQARESKSAPNCLMDGLFMKDSAQVQKAVTNLDSPSVSKRRYRQTDIASVTLPLKIRTKVWISHVESPSEVWIQVVSEDHTMFLKSIAVQNKNYETTEFIENKPQIGHLYMSKVAGGKWYRSLVLSVVPPDKVTIRYLDFGNTNTVLVNTLRPLPEDMLCPAAQAVRCCIAGIVPAVGKDWSEQAKKVTLSLVRTDTDYEVEAIEKHGDLYLINMFELNSGINIIQRFISSKIALPVATHKKVMAEDIKSIVDELQLEQKLNLYFIDCKSPSDITAQILEEQRVEQFHHLLKEILENVTVSPPKIPYRPEVGEIVLGCYTADNCWTRAEVTQVTDSDAMVRYIDYGNAEKLKFSRITSLKPKFSRLPAQAIKCFLSVQHAPEQWSEKDIANFKDQIGFGTEKADRNCIVKEKLSGRLGLEIFNKTSQSLSDMFSSCKPQIQTTLPIMADSLKSVSLPLDGSLVSATVVDMVSFNNFSIQLVSEDAIQSLRMLMDDIQDYVETADNHPNPCVGELVCARFSDNAWYRCKVKKIEDDHCLLLFIDFGNEDRVHKSLIKIIDKRFVNIPVQAVTCKLAGATKTADADVKIVAKSVVSCVNEFKAISYNNSLYEVEIFLVDGNCLNEMFRKSSGAVSPLKDQEASVIINPIKPILHEFQAAAISFVLNPGNFYCQLLRKEFEELANINESMSHYCKTEPVPKEFNPNVGDFCFGEFLGSFYRARVEKKLPNGQFELQYVDYGNVESVSLKDMRPMVKKFAEIPFLAVKCALNDLQPKESDWSEEASTMLKQFMGKLMLLKVTDIVNGHCIVDLMQKDKPNIHVGQMLINKGVALLKTAENDFTTSDTSTKSPSIPSMAAQLHVGKRLQVLISDYTPPNQIILEIVDQTILDERNELQAKLNQIVHKKPVKGFSPSVGEFVLAQFSEDQQWYRAKIEAVSDKNIQILYVDFGNRETLDISSILPLSLEWSKQPAFILNCFIEGIENEELSPQGIALCQKALCTVLLSSEMPIAEAEVKSLKEDSIGIDLYRDDHILSSEIKAVLPLPVMAKFLCSEELPIEGNLVDCEIIHVEDLKNFFVRKDSTECRNALNDLTVSLNRYYENVLESHKPVIGEVVAAQFSQDNTWNRGLVFEVTAHWCRVNFIDFGNNEQVIFSSIRKLKEVFSKLAIQAIPCELAGIPNEMLASGDIKEKFVQLVADTKVKVKVIPSNNQLQYAVEVYLPDGNNVKDLLCMDKDDQSLITSVCLKYHQPKEKEFQIAIQEVVNPSDFYCTELDITAVKEQTELNKTLAVYCSKETTPTCTNLKKGDLCCGLYEGEWFRGEVKKVLPDNKVVLLYIDYGNTSEVDLSDTRVILKEHVQPKVMTLHCRLYDVSPLGHTWDAKATELLSRRKETLLNAVVIKEKDRLYTVQLTDPQTGTDIAKEMVKAGLALDDETIKKQLEFLQGKLAEL